MPDEVISHVLAQTYHTSPLIVDRWPHVERQKYLAVINEIGAGKEYRQALDKFKTEQPLDPAKENEEADGW